MAEKDRGTPFTPEVGRVYPLHSERLGHVSRYRCKAVDVGTAEFENVVTGWTLTAHVPRLYRDGSIAWAYSTDGRFGTAVWKP